MNFPSLEEVKTFCEKLWADEYGGDRLKIEVRRDCADNTYTIKVSQMYQYMSLNFAKLKKLSDFFGTDNINDSRYSREGCEMCDYGSSYEITLTVAPNKEE